MFVSVDENYHNQHINSAVASYQDANVIEDQK